MKIETQIKLDKFKPRKYQLNLSLAIEEGKLRKFLAIWPRRAGKDFTIFNMMLRCALRRVGSYFYCLPTFKQARLVIWDSITISGEKFLSCIPKELIKRMNQQEMFIELVNGSIVRLIGSDTFDTSLVGTNPLMIIFSEYALADKRAYTYVRPILNANQGTVIIASTPRGHNHFYDLYQIAKSTPDEWFCELLTIDDTKHIPIESIKRDIANGEVSKELAAQEYWCDFSLGIEGSYYGHYMDKMRLEGRIGEVPYEPSHLVHCAFDLGVDNATAIVFYQAIGAVIHVIDYYQNVSQGLEHYAHYLRSKSYTYGKLFAPHDIQVKEQGTGITRMDKASHLGIPFTLSRAISLEDGREAVRTMLPRCWIDQKKCGKLIKALENHRREFDEKHNVYFDRAVKDQYSDAADAFRYAAVNIRRLDMDSSPEELERRYRDTIYGQQSNLPPMFDDRHGRGY